MAQTHCPVCKEQLAEPASRVGGRDAVAVSCRKCGLFQITETAVAALRVRNEDRHILSGMCRLESNRGHALTLTTNNIDDIIKSAPIPRSPVQAVDNLILYLGDHSKGFSEYVKLDPDSPPITVSLDPDDLTFIWTHLAQRGEIEIANGNNFRLTVEGWSRYQDLQAIRPNSQKAFVAMAYASDLLPAYQDGIEPALKEAGYTPVRLDFTEHNQTVDDEIIAQIRRSGLVVADLTRNNSGVYFEAGFAMGLGIPVVWTCYSNDIKDVHVDVRLQNYIDWTSPEELRRRLRDRVEALYPVKRVS